MIAVYILAGIGLLFNLLGVAGLFRFPDAYTRLHASTKCTTFGSLFLGASVLVYFVFFHSVSNDPLAGPQTLLMVTHGIVAIVALLIASAAESHAIARAAHRSGLKPMGVTDAMEGKK